MDREGVVPVAADVELAPGRHVAGRERQAGHVRHRRQQAGLHGGGDRPAGGQQARRVQDGAQVCGDVGQLGQQGVVEAGAAAERQHAEDPVARGQADQQQVAGVQGERPLGLPRQVRLGGGRERAQGGLVQAQHPVGRGDEPRQQPDRPGGGAATAHGQGGDGQVARPAAVGRDAGDEVGVVQAVGEHPVGGADEQPGDAVQDDVVGGAVRGGADDGGQQAAHRQSRRCVSNQRRTRPQASSADGSW